MLKNYLDQGIPGDGAPVKKSLILHFGKKGPVEAYFCIFNLSYLLYFCVAFYIDINKYCLTREVLTKKFLVYFLFIVPIKRKRNADLLVDKLVPKFISGHGFSVGV